MKQKTVFRCTECGYAASKWLGKCPDCGAWNAFVEEGASLEQQKKPILSGASAMPLSETSMEAATRIQTGISELDSLLGAGMVPGSLILLGGAPGIGKSTILLELAAACKKSVLYVTGEESPAQVKSRTQRLKIPTDNISLLATNNIDDAEHEINRIKPEIIIIDSIQTIAHPEIGSIAGSVAQVREVATRLLRIGKKYNSVVFLAGHITKEGTIAGPKILEHIVDVVLYFEDEKGIYRIIRSFKNRFGTTSELAIFEMTSTGLMPVENPDSLFYLDDESPTSGTVLTSVIEGTRPMMIEMQALVSRTSFGMARRQVTGIDFNRLTFLIAVIEKRLGITLGNQDIFVNVVGGIKIKEPAVDLAIIAGILSSALDIVVPKNMLFIGEVGLGGEIRDCSLIKERLLRAKKLGITACIIPAHKKQKILIPGLEIKQMKHISDVLGYVKSIKSLSQKTLKD